MLVLVGSVAVKKSVVSRKTFVAREDLLNRLVEIAKSQGCSLFELVNELFKLAIDSNDIGFSLKQVVAERQQLQGAKGAGFVLGLENLWYDMAELTYAKGKRQAQEKWFDTGVWFASRYTTSGIADPLEAFKADLQAFTWNAPEFGIQGNGDKLSVKVTSPRFNEAYTFLFLSFLEGALSSFGYKTVDQAVSRGVIRLESVRSQ